MLLCVRLYRVFNNVHRQRCTRSNRINDGKCSSCWPHPQRSLLAQWGRSDNIWWEEEEEEEGLNVISIVNGGCYCHSLLILRQKRQFPCHKNSRSTIIIRAVLLLLLLLLFELNNIKKINKREQKANHARNVIARIPPIVVAGVVLPPHSSRGHRRWQQQQDERNDNTCVKFDYY